MTKLERPSRRQAEIMRALEEDGELHDYFERRTVEAMQRRGWIDRVVEYSSTGCALSATLRITTRGRWALRAADQTGGHSTGGQRKVP